MSTMHALNSGKAMAAIMQSGRDGLDSAIQGICVHGPEETGAAMMQFAQDMVNDGSVDDVEMLIIAGFFEAVYERLNKASNRKV